MSISHNYSDYGSFKELSASYKTMLLNEAHSDIAFKLVSSERSYPSHKIILSARCPALLNEATTDAEENQVITITGVSDTVFLFFLEWIYTSNIVVEEIRLADMFTLIELSEKYNIARLKVYTFILLMFRVL